MDIKKSGMIAIVGRPNVGKSTLTNALVGDKVAIVTNKPQTTRNRICGVLTRGESQFVFVDTPGLHKARTRLGDYMVEVVRQSVADVDAVVLVVEPIPHVGAPEEELIARIHAVMRRREGGEGPAAKKLEYDKLVINLDSYELIVDGKKVDTPPKEMELLYHLAASPNRVFTRNQLLDEVWGFDYFGDSRTVDVHIKRLREKLEGVSDQWSLKTVWGVGYKFEVVSPQ